ncbi:MAG: efflux RND transporter periplasmic adaptor subunit [Flavobacteriales bacterium]|nr:efflux RND transporter periplasmic adaptor subunit [Flavobacteriales bacterium]
MKTIQFLSILILATATACTSETAEQDHSQDNEHDHDHGPGEVQGLSLADTSVYKLQLTAPSYRLAGDTLLLRGMVEAPPQSRISLALPYGGQVTSLKYYEGAFVKKGALLAEVRHNDYINLQEDFLRLSAEKEQSESAWNRQQDLKGKGSTSERAYEEARNAYKSVDARLQGVVARMKLAGISPDAVMRLGIQDEVRVYAPVSGYITAINANIGRYISANEAICEMVDNSHLHIELAVFPDQVSKLEVGQSVYFRTDGREDRMHGTVYLISQDVKAESRAVNVHVHPDEGITGLLPGMFVTATVYLSKDSIYGLPPAAVTERDGKMIGLAAEGERFELVSFSENDVAGSGVVVLPENEKRRFVTGNLQRAVSAYLRRC